MPSIPWVARYSEARRCECNALSVDPTDKALHHGGSRGGIVRGIPARGRGSPGLRRAVRGCSAAVRSPDRAGRFRSFRAGARRSGG